MGQLAPFSAGIPTVADAAGRGLAIPSPVNGQKCYRLDTNAFEEFNGSSWVAIATSAPAGTMRWLGAWSGATAYAVNDVVTLASAFYICILAHTNHTPALGGNTYWTEISASGSGPDTTGTHWKGTYAGGTTYAVNDLVRFENGVYVCILATTGNAPTYQAANTWWVPLVNPMNWRGGWNGATAYVVGDTVGLGPSAWTCKLDHTNQIPVIGGLYWTNITLPMQFQGAYNAAFTYTRGSVVTLGGAVYHCLLENGGLYGAAQTPVANPTYWTQVIGAGSLLTPKGAWSGATNYVVNDLVTSGGNAYICILNHINFVPPNGTYWALFLTGVTSITWRNAWDVATAYVLNDAVSFGGSSYICILGHTGHQPPTPAAAPNTWWALLSSKGDTGATGAGTTGAAGPQGPVGPAYPITISTAAPSGTGTVGALWAQTEV